MVTTFDLPDPEKYPDKIKTSHEVYYDDPPKLMTAHFGDEYKVDGMQTIAKGLEVDVQTLPNPRPWQGLGPTCGKVSEKRYEFRSTGGAGRPRPDNWILFHILLPEKCYIDRDNFENNTKDEAIVVTRNERQSIDLLFAEGLNIDVVGGFIGPDEGKYKRLQSMYPKVYVAPGTQYPE